MGTVLFLSLRALHVLLSATWLGATVMMTFIVMPSAEATGPAGGQVMMAMNKRGLTAFFASLGGITVLTGFYLYWHFTGGFDPEVSRSHAGVAFGIGGLAGLIAVILGGAVVGRSAGKMVEVMEKAVNLPDNQRGPLMQEANGLRQKMKSFGTIVLILQVIALLLMSVGHYI